MKSFYFTLLVSLFSIIVVAQPANDSCWQVGPTFTLEPVTDPNPNNPPVPVCLSGSTINATPENITLNDCDLTLYNVVWYQINTDVNATVLNLAIDATGANPPNLIMALFTGDCSSLEAVSLSGASIDCVISNGSSLSVPQVYVQPNHTYYLAVGSETSPGGTFDVCASTEALLQGCINSHEVSIIAREHQLPLTFPLLPGELVTFNYHVEYGVDPAGTGNNCQWLQGIIPILGDGWEYDKVAGIPSSFSGVWSWHQESEVDYNWHNFRYSTYVENGNLKIAHYMGNSANYNPANSFSAGTELPAGWYASSPGNSLFCTAGSSDPDETYGAPATCGSVYVLNNEFSIRVKQDFIQGDKLDVVIYEFSDGSIGCWNQQRCGLDLPVVFDWLELEDSIYIDLPSSANCHGDTLQFFAVGANSSSFSWVFEGGSPEISSSASPLVSYTQSGIFDVSLVVTQDDTSYSFFWEDTVVIEDQPIANFELQQDSLINMSLHATNYSWYVDNVFQSNSEHITISNQGDYQVMLVASNSCGSDSLTQQIIISATNSLPVLHEGMKVLPNPNRGAFTLAFDKPIGTYELSIIDSRGLLVKVNTFNQQNQKLSLTDLAAGMYVLRVVAEEGIYINKMIVVE